MRFAAMGMVLPIVWPNEGSGFAGVNAAFDMESPLAGRSLNSRAFSDEELSKERWPRALSLEDSDLLAQGEELNSGIGPAAEENANAGKNSENALSHK